MRIIERDAVVLYDLLSDEQKRLADLCSIDMFETNACDHLLIDSVVQQNRELNFAYRDHEPHIEWTPLKRAVENDNVYLVRMLLSCGADPDAYIAGDMPVLWDLQYLWNAADCPNAEKASQEAEMRYEIALLLLEHGADPFSNPYDSESLYEFVRYQIFNEFGERDYEYLVRFYTALAVYGARKRPDAFSEVCMLPDTGNIRRYSLGLAVCDDNYHITGEIRDSEGNTVIRL